MGRDCYDLGFHKYFEGKKIFVATSKKLENYDNIHFINGDIVSIILDLIATYKYKTSNICSNTPYINISIFYSISKSILS